MFSASEKAPVERIYGGDSGAPPQRGYEWWAVKPTAAGEVKTLSSSHLGLFSP